MTPHTTRIVAGLTVGLAVGAAVPAAAAGLLLVLPVAAVTAVVSWWWRRTGWGLWPLVLAAGAGLWLAVSLGAAGLYGAAAAFLVEGRGTAVETVDAALLTLPLAVPAGVALAVPLLVRRQTVARVAALLRPRWSDLDPDTVERCPLCDGDGRLVREEAKT